MSKNNLLRKSDKKFIRSEKSRIRRHFFDSKKQEEMITELYKRFIKADAPKVQMPKTELKKSVAKKAVSKKSVVRAE